MRSDPACLRPLLGGALLVLAALTATPANAQSYPSRPLKLIVPLGAGGASDLNARVLAEKLSERLGQSVVVENRPGAEGIIGVDAAAKSAPDGYTLVLGSSTTLAANYSLRAKLPFDPVGDFSPVSMAFKNAFNILVIHPSVPAQTLTEFITYARTRPGQLFYGTATSGSKICAEMFKSQAGVNLAMVNYKSSEIESQDEIGGNSPPRCRGGGPRLRDRLKQRKLHRRRPGNGCDGGGAAPLTSLRGTGRCDPGRRAGRLSRRDGGHGRDP